MQEPIPFGRYTLVKRLAVSSMSEVFLAFPETRRAEPEPVIIKRLLEDVAAVEAFVDLFHNEADLAAFMHHPNVVQFLEFGEVDGQLYLAMEYVEGLDLWRLTRRLKRAGEKLPPAQAIFIVLEVLKALSYVHGLMGENGERLDIVHHDVSPSNIMLGRDATVKLGDFGIAYSEQNLEKLGRKFKGKVFYLSPEQVKGDRVDHRSDLYSAGVVLAELILGKRPFSGPTDLSILINVRDRYSPVLKEELGALPPDLARIIDSALATDPEDRFPDAEAFGSSLEKILEPGDLEAAARELPETIQSVTRSTDGIDAAVIPRRSSGYNLYRVLTTPLPVELLEGEGEEGSPTPVTPIRDPTDYEIKKADGSILGVLPLSAVVESIVLGRIEEEDLVSVAGGDFQLVQSVPELSKHLPSVTPTTQKHELGLPDRRGMIEDVPAGRILLDMYRDRETGLVIFVCAGVRKEVHIEEGVPRFVSSNMASELLGEFLVRIGSISRMELDMALAVLDRYEGHLGDTLLGLDIMDSISLLRDITRQIKERLFDLFTWQEGEFQFYRGAQHSREDFRLTAQPLELIRDGFLHALEQDDMEAWFEQHRDCMLSIEYDVEFPLHSWSFSSTYELLLSDLERERSLEEIMNPYRHTSPAARAKLLRVIRFGVKVGFISGIERESLVSPPPGPG